MGKRGKPFSEENPPPGGAAKGRATKQPSQLLADMRWVYNNPWDKDESAGKANCRALLKESTEKFLARLSQLEKEHQELKLRVHQERKERHELPDEGEGKLLDLIDGLLTDWENSNVGER